MYIFVFLSLNIWIALSLSHTHTHTHTHTVSLSLSLCLSVYLFVRLSVCPCICLSVCSLPYAMLVKKTEYMIGIHTSNAISQLSFGKILFPILSSPRINERYFLLQYILHSFIRCTGATFLWIQPELSFVCNLSKITTYRFSFMKWKKWVNKWSLYSQLLVHFLLSLSERFLIYRGLS